MHHDQSGEYRFSGQSCRQLPQNNDQQNNGINFAQRIKKNNGIHSHLEYQTKAGRSASLCFRLSSLVKHIAVTLQGRDPTNVQLSFSNPLYIHTVTFTVQSTLVLTRSLGLAKLALCNLNDVIRGRQNKETQSANAIRDFRMYSF